MRDLDGDKSSSELSYVEGMSDVDMNEHGQNEQHEESNHNDQNDWSDDNNQNNQDYADDQDEEEEPLRHLNQPFVPRNRDVDVGVEEEGDDDMGDADDRSNNADLGHNAPGTSESTINTSSNISANGESENNSVSNENYTDACSRGNCATNNSSSTEPRMTLASSSNHKARAPENASGKQNESVKPTVEKTDSDDEPILTPRGRLQSLNCVKKLGNQKSNKKSTTKKGTSRPRAKSKSARVESDEDDTEPISRGRKSIRRAALNADEVGDGESESSSDALGEVVGLAGEDGGDEVCSLFLFQTFPSMAMCFWPSAVSQQPRLCCWATNEALYSQAETYRASVIYCPTFPN
jgi:hypothetical protein